MTAELVEYLARRLVEAPDAVRVEQVDVRAGPQLGALVEHLRVRRALVRDCAGQSLSRRRKDIIGMLCVERETAGQHDIETECLLYYDEVQRACRETSRKKSKVTLRKFCGCLTCARS